MIRFGASSADHLMEERRAEACSLLSCGEDPNAVSLSDLKQRFYGDLRENRPNLTVWTDPRCAVVNTDKLGQFAKLSDGSILTVGGNETFTSREGGDAAFASQLLVTSHAASAATIPLMFWLFELAIGGSLPNL